MTLVISCVQRLQGECAQTRARACLGSSESAASACAHRDGDNHPTATTRRNTDGIARQTSSEPSAPPREVPPDTPHGPGSGLQETTCPVLLSAQAPRCCARRAHALHTQSAALPPFAATRAAHSPRIKCHPPSLPAAISRPQTFLRRGALSCGRAHAGRVGGEPCMGVRARQGARRRHGGARAGHSAADGRTRGAAW